jgi:hypothetical protein
MILAAIILFSLAAVLGIILLSYFFRKIETPKSLAFIHGPLAAIGLVLLIINAIGTGEYIIPIVIFVIAAILGSITLMKDLFGKSVPIALPVFHGLLAVTGYLILVLNYFGSM